MKVAEILSDLTSLQVCEPDAALALVSARPDRPNNKQERNHGKDEESDPELRRAKDLIALHANVKVAHEDGTDPELNAAREAVRGVLRTL